MNEQELRAYALRGLTARLTELDDERARILVLLGEWDTAEKPAARRKVRTPRSDLGATLARHDETVDATQTLAVVRPDAGSLAEDAEPEVARVLPRRNRAQVRPPADPPAPALPPMPRLVKARAS